MRPALFGCVSLAALVACSEPESDIIAAQINWMEWPAEVLASEPFSVRMIGYALSCREILHFDPGATIDASAVTLEPFFLVSRHPAPCPLYGRAIAFATRPPIIPPFFDTRAPVAGLTPPAPRTYEIRGAADVSAGSGSSSRGSLPVRTFGDVIVRSAAANPSRTNVGGMVYTYRDTTGCLVIGPFGVGIGYVVENPPDTTTYWTAFVRGYLYKPAASVCGASEVFHLVSRD
jgi:hypothetical protein